MGTLPSVTFASVRKILRTLGFKKIRPGGRHEIWDNGTGHIVVVQKGRGEVKPRTLRSIVQQAGCASVAEFLKHK